MKPSTVPDSCVTPTRAGLYSTSPEPSPSCPRPETSTSEEIIRAGSFNKLCPVPWCIISPPSHNLRVLHLLLPAVLNSAPQHVGSTMSILLLGHGSAFISPCRRAPPLHSKFPTGISTTMKITSSPPLFHAGFNPCRCSSGRANPASPEQFLKAPNLPSLQPTPSSQFQTLPDSCATTAQARSPPSSAHLLQCQKPPSPVEITRHHSQSLIQSIHPHDALEPPLPNDDPRSHGRTIPNTGKFLFSTKPFHRSLDRVFPISHGHVSVRVKIQQQPNRDQLEPSAPLPQANIRALLVR